MVGTTAMRHHLRPVLSAIAIRWLDVLAQYDLDSKVSETRVDWVEDTPVLLKTGTCVVPTLLHHIDPIDQIHRTKMPAPPAIASSSLNRPMI